MSRTSKSALVSLIVAAALAPAALAQPPAETASIRVAFGDLNLSTAAGGKTLLSRIVIAARKACEKAMTTSLLQPHAISSCKHETVASAVRQLDAATLTAAWERAPGSTAIASR